jgi:glycosyltransferase involved in cell wall biosynthesis
MIPSWLTFVLVAGLPTFVVGLALFNLLVWPRGEESDIEAEVSVLIPARDEASVIEECIRRIFDGGVDLAEVIVYDDRSSDGTSEILAELAEEFDALEVVDGEPLPDGWVGKPHACHRLVEHASGELLVFVDADTFVEPGGLARLLSLAESGPADKPAMVSAVPRQIVESFGERLVVPLLHVTYTSWLPLPLVWRSSDPRFVAANGQLMCLRREALADVGGFRAICDAVVDDVELAKRFKHAGETVVFADGYHMARCRMYESFAEVWEGFSKNMYEGLGSRTSLLALAVGLYVGTFIMPYLALGAWAVGFGGATLGLAAAVGVGANLVLRTAHVLAHGHPVEGILLHPIGVAAVVAIALNSARWHRNGQVQWAGRSYSARADRKAAEPSKGDA